MLRVSIESKIKNIMIVDDKIYFQDNKGAMVPHPANRYAEGTDSYEITNDFIFTGEYLNFNDINEVEAFKDYCITYCNEHEPMGRDDNLYLFNYPEVNPLRVHVESFDDPTYETKDELMAILKNVCEK